MEWKARGASPRTGNNETETMQRSTKIIIAFAVLAALEAIGFAIVIHQLNHL